MFRDHLNNFFTDLLLPESFCDYCPNGLQIEGSDHIQKIAFAVSATSDSIHQAISLQADTLVVHHGLFWYFQGTRTLTGHFASRCFPLIRHNINLYAFHLPLDAHSEIGNAALLGQFLGCNYQSAFGNYKESPTGIKGVFEQPILAKTLRFQLQSLLNHPIIMASPDENQLIKTVGIITGGASSDWILAQQAGLDAYITGEITEHDWHESQENGIHMFAGGHHATERFGIQALMDKLQKSFNDLVCVFIDSNNPA